MDSRTIKRDLYDSYMKQDFETCFVLINQLSDLGKEDVFVKKIKAGIFSFPGSDYFDVDKAIAATKEALKDYPESQRILLDLAILGSVFNYFQLFANGLS